MNEQPKIFISSTCFLFNPLENQDSIPIWPDGIEMSGNFPYYPDADLRRKLDMLSKSHALLIHGYFPVPEKSFILTFASGEKTSAENSFLLAGKALDLCGRYNVPYYSFHPGYLLEGHAKPDGHFSFKSDTEITHDKAKDIFIRNFKILRDSAGGVALVIENLFENPSILGGGGRRSSLNCSFEEFDEILSSLPEDIGILLDLGHLNMSAEYLGFDKFKYIDKMIGKYANRIFELHISANNGLFDQHLPPEPGDWQLQAVKMFSVCPGINSCGLNLTLEARKISNDAILKTADLIRSQL